MFDKTVLQCSADVQQMFSAFDRNTTKQRATLLHIMLVSKMFGAFDQVLTRVSVAEFGS